MIRDFRDSEVARQEALSQIVKAVDKRREKKDGEDLIRTRALESLARDGTYARIAAISAIVAP